MILAVLEYLIVFAVSMISFSCFQSLHRRVEITGIPFHRSKPVCALLFSLAGCFFLFPLIAMHGLRYGIGTDYFSYEQVFNALHDVSFLEYWHRHISGARYYYVELGYYFLNILSPEYRSLLWVMGVLIFLLFGFALNDYRNKMNIAFALFIYLSTQYIFSLNGTRFSIAVLFVLLSYIALIENKTRCFFVCIVLAALFHKTALCCVLFIFLKNYKAKNKNNIRNIIFLFGIILFPLLSNYLFQLLSQFSFFSRYFSSYRIADVMGSGWMWMFHISPVLVPLLYFARKQIFSVADTSILFRLCAMEIPLRMLGLYNTWFTRLSRYAQIALVLFIPLVIARIGNKQLKYGLYIYYFVWFTFYFAYYAIVNDNADSLPYVSIFSK